MFTFSINQANRQANNQNLTPPNVEVALNEDGLLPIDVLTAPIAIKFPVWSEVSLNTSYQLLWDDTPTGETKIIKEDDQPGDILTLDIPVEDLTEGKHRLAYRLTNLENGVQSDSPSVPVEVDLTAPGTPLLAPIIFPSVIEDGLTSPELEDLNNILKGEIASYNDMKPGDLIQTYWNGVEGPIVVVDDDDMGLRRLFIDFSRAFLESIGDIDAPVYYTVTDLAGNQSGHSTAKVVKLSLSVLPALPIPIVKEAEGDILNPDNAPNGITMVVGSNAELRSNDKVTAHWSGPKGSDIKEKVITDVDAGKELAIVFSATLATANIGEIVTVSYTVNRRNGAEQTSDVLALKILSDLQQLPAPTLDTVGPDGILNPVNIPDSGATLRVSYEAMSTGDSVIAHWQGASNYDTPSQVVGGNTELLFTVPKALITATAGNPASLTYSVTRAGTARTSLPLMLRVSGGLVLDTSPVTLSGKIYLIPGSPDLLPNFPADTTIQRLASGGQAPYVYSSSDTGIVQVDGNGLASVRGKGTATISVSDALGESKSYPVTVTGVIHCLGLGTGNYAQMNGAAQGQGARIPSVNELNEIFNSYGSRWPMGNGNYWSSTVAAHNIAGMKWYYVKNLVTGANFKLFEHNASLGVALR